MQRVWRPRIALAFVILLAALAVATVVALLLRGDSAPAIAGIPCERERLDFHAHVELSIFVEGRPVEVPTGVGIRGDCHYWLHTHDATGLVHVEAPSPREFRLGEFFAIWGKPLSGTQLLDVVTDNDHSIRASVNGQAFPGDPADIILRDRDIIALEYGPPFASP